MKEYVIGITGASGSILAKTCLTVLAEQPVVIHCVISDQGKAVFNYELDESFDHFINTLQNSPAVIHHYDSSNLFAPIASGSYPIDGMIILPCSMGTLARIANGITDSLLIRAADVIIKEKRQMILVTRETPLSSIHLNNMLRLSEAGVMIMPPVPQFYNSPSTIEEVSQQFIGRLLNTFGIKTDYHKVWIGGKNV